MTTVPDKDMVALENALLAARDRLHTPEAVGIAVVDFVLTEAVSRGTVAADGTRAEIPLTATIELPQREVADSSDTGHAKLCITAFGHEIVCIETTVHGEHH